MYDETIRNLRNESKYALPSQTRKALIEAADVLEKLEITIAGLNEVIKGLADDMPCWIPVTERLPREMETVLITDGKNVSWSFCVNDYGTMDFYSPWNVTHWMPLPEPPKEG